MNFEEARRHFERGMQQQSNGDLDAAEQTFASLLLHERELLASPISALARRSLAKVFRKQGRLDEAQTQIERALALDYELEDSEGITADYEFLAVLHLTAGRTDRAEEAIHSALRLDPHSRSATAATALGNLGLIYRRRKDRREATRLFLRSLRIARALERDDISATQYANLAFVSLERGEVSRARVLLEMAVQLFDKLNMRDSLSRARKILALIKAQP